MSCNRKRMKLLCEPCDVALAAHAAAVAAAAAALSCETKGTLMSAFDKRNVSAVSLSTDVDEVASERLLNKFISQTKWMSVCRLPTSSSHCCCRRSMRRRAEVTTVAKAAVVLVVVVVMVMSTRRVQQRQRRRPMTATTTRTSIRRLLIACWRAVALQLRGRMTISWRWRVRRPATTRAARRRRSRSRTFSRPMTRAPCSRRRIVHPLCCFNLHR